MNINGFRRWLKAQIVPFDDDSEFAGDRIDETIAIIREQNGTRFNSGWLAWPSVAVP